MFDSGVTLLAVVVVAAIAFVAGLFVGVERGRGKSGALRGREEEAWRARLDEVKDENARLMAQCSQLRAQIDGLDQQLVFAKSQLAQAQQAERVRMEHDRDRMEEENRRRAKEREDMMGERSQVVTALAPVQKTLEALRGKVSQMEESRRQEMGVLGERLKGLGDQQGRLDRETAALASALRDNKVRGAWGEAQLRNIVESAGLLEHVDFDVQVVVQDDSGRNRRPDMVIHLPGGAAVPIDAKVPYADYQRACAIPDTASPQDLDNREKLLRAHAKALREHVHALSQKAYWKTLPVAPDFVIAFIPNESLLQAALRVDPTLLDDAFAQNVALTSPVTLWAVLKSMSYSWQQQSLSDEARELYDLSRELYGRFSILGARAVSLGSAITKTVTAYNQFASSLESRVLVTARKLHKVDMSTTIADVGLIDSEDGDVRELTAPEVRQAED
ncbi:DNA recombination protein RmuC [uncultured Bifidobacterium sp.]|uniref:DNA recombination protein RmuC n=1 Tax=uncultured Bifidobacterium sp. TaxID=165187 RepID=UPI00261EA031|nr:DNA recombination protein RmuC [uncultured Bifidobacterium sp.]